MTRPEIDPRSPGQLADTVSRGDNHVGDVS